MPSILLTADYDRLRASSVAAEKDITVISSGSTGRLQLAEAAVSEAAASVDSESASLQAAQARLAQAEANFSRAEADRRSCWKPERTRTIACGRGCQWRLG